MYGQAKRVQPLQPLAQASEFYVPNGNHDSIALTTNGHPDILASSAGRGVHSRAQSARALPGVLMAKGVLSILKFFRSAHFF